MFIDVDCRSHQLYQFEGKVICCSINSFVFAAIAPYQIKCQQAFTGILPRFFLMQAFVIFILVSVFWAFLDSFVANVSSEVL